MPPAASPESAAPRRSHSHWWDPAWNRATWSLFFLFMGITAAILIFTLLAAQGQTKADPATQAIAQQLAGGPVQAFRGTKHTVYQATAPLPTAQNPRSDGRLTLAWLSGTTCGDCQKMEPFVWTTLKEYASDFVVMEKDLGRQPAYATYGVTRPPEFVLLSPDGRALARFGYQPTAAALKTAIAAALGQARAG